jgi:hypothetical protein
MTQPFQPKHSNSAASPAAFAVFEGQGATQMGKFCKSPGRGIQRYDGEFAEPFGSPKMKGWCEPIIAHSGMATAAIGKTAEC